MTQTTEAAIFHVLATYQGETDHVGSYPTREEAEERAEAIRNAGNYDSVEVTE